MREHDDGAKDKSAEEALAEMISAAPPTEQARRVRPLLRVLGLVLLIVSGWAFLFATGAIEHFEEEKLRALVSEAGLYGVALFLVAFVGAQILHLPGAVFIAVASLAWGSGSGTLIAWAGAVLAVTVNFALVKTVGGDMLVALDRPLLGKLLSHLHRRPQLTIFAARGVFMTSPWLATTLALAGVRQRDHFIASALGMLPQIVVWTVAVDWLV